MENLNPPAIEKLGVTTEVDRQSGAMSKSAFAAYLTKFTQ